MSTPNRTAPADPVPQPLQFVCDELAVTLGEARAALEQYAEGELGSAPLERCAQLLHAAKGVLQITETYGASLLAEEMEQVCRYLLKGRRGGPAEDGVEALMRSAVQLPAYVERIRNGGRDVPLVLLPLLNDLRAARGRPLLSESTLLLLNLAPRAAGPTAAPEPLEPSGEDVAELCKALRPRFQLALLGWIRGDAAQGALARLREVAGRFEAAAATEQSRQLWWVVGGVLEALADQGLESSVALKRLIGQADREIKRIQSVGEEKFAEHPPVDLINNLLYYVARARSHGPRVAAIREAFNLSGLIPGDEQVEAVRRNLSAPSVRLMQTVAGAIREDLARVKDVLDIYVRTGMERAEELAPQSELLKKIGDTLGVLGLGELREIVLSRRAELEDIVAGDRAPDEATLVAMAAALLDMEDRLERELIGMVSPDPAVADEGTAPPAEVDGEQALLTQAVMRECLANLARVKEAISLVTERSGDGAALDAVPSLLKGITAALLMLEKERAARIAGDIGAAVTAVVQDGATTDGRARLERLADAIVSLEYYMETLQAGRREPVYMLDNAAHCLGALGPLPLPAMPEAPPAETDTRAVTVQLPVAATVIVPRPGPSAERPVVAGGGADIDPEILELFIEEAREAIDTLRTQFPAWELDEGEREALLGIRRAFHTLKGSGRMVGAELIGDYCWSVEHLLNRVIDGTVARSPEIVAFLRRAIACIAELLEQLEVGTAPRVDVAALMAEADSLARGGFAATLAVEQPEAAEAEGATEVLPALEIGAALGPVPTPAPAPQPERPAPAAMDPVLLDILAREVAVHLGAIGEFTARAGSGSEQPLPEEVFRAGHTLLGSLTMAGAGPAVRVAAPLNDLLGTLYESHQRVEPHMVAALEESAAAVARVIEHLREPGQPLPDFSELTARLAELAAEAAARSAILAAGPVDSGTVSVEIPVLPDATVAVAALEEGVPGEDVDFAAFPDEPEEPVLPVAEFGTAGFEVGEFPADEVADGEFPGAAAPAEAGTESGEFPAVEFGEGDFPSGLFATGGFPMPEVGAGDEAPGGTGAFPAAVPPDEAPATGESVLPYDAEVAAIFAEEAAELLESCEGALARLAAGGDGQALAEIQRGLHTLKGGARMAGLFPMGDLSHELETLLLRVGDGLLPAGADVWQLVQSTLDELHRLREQIPLGIMASASPDLRTRLAAAQAGAPLPAEPEPPRSVTAPVAPPGEPVVAEAPREATEARDLPEPELPPVVEPPPEAGALPEPEPTPEPIPVYPPEPPVMPPSLPALERLGELARELEAPPAVEAAPAPEVEPLRAPTLPPREVRGAEPRDYARVESGLLEQLLNNAGEVSIANSRLNQQMSLIQFNLDELSQTVVRLRDQLRKLEMETEAQILHRHQAEPGRNADFDPLELDRYSSIQQLSRGLAETASDVNSLKDLIHNLSADAEAMLVQQARTTNELQDGLMRTRMVPFHQHGSRLARLVRQTAKETGKLADLAIEGGGELDRQVLEKMLPPFEHMLRNAVIHGIETPMEREASAKPVTGLIRIVVRREGAEVVIEIADDGRGLDVGAIRRKAVELGFIGRDQSVTDEEAMQFILRSGFSTADQLTQAAGRGIGMDVVASQVAKLGGTLGIASRRGQGTTFTIRLPFTLAVTQALIVRAATELYALPLPTVEGIIRIPRREFEERMAEPEPAIAYGGQKYLIRHLGQFLGLPSGRLPEEQERVSIILVRAGENSTALVADEMQDSREIVVKPVGAQLATIRGVSGATILGDGRIVLILDVGALVRTSRTPAAVPPPPEPELVQPTALVVDDSITMRRVTQRLLERNGFRVQTAKDGVEAISVLQDHRPDIILLDVEMPRMDGYEFARHVRNNPATARVPIIMVTSRVSEKHRARAIEIGVNDYLGKPYQERELLEAVHHQLVSVASAVDGDVTR